jgi:GAF domain-containing protein
VQYDVNDGPCLQALRTARTVRVDDIAHDTRWEAFSRRAQQAGAGSSVSVPLRINGEAVGALNLHSAKAHGLVNDDFARAHQFADQAAAAVALAPARPRRQRPTPADRTAIAVDDRPGHRGPHRPDRCRPGQSL